MARVLHQSSDEVLKSNPIKHLPNTET